MKRLLKCLTVAISLLVVLAALSGTAFACTTANIVSNADMRIQQRIDTCVSLADNATSQVKVDQVINRMLTQTNSIAAQAAGQAARNGDTIVSEYIPVNIGGSVIMVDPVRMY